jgi:hypothetical protein
MANKIMKYCGIDCGVTGAIAFSDGTYVKMPVFKDTIDSKKVVSAYGVYKALKDNKPDVIILEEQQPMGNKTSRISCFAMGRNYQSVLFGVAEYAEKNEVKIIGVKPAAWKKVMQLETEKTIKDKKAKTFVLVKNVFGLDLPKSYDGVADALALAEYGRRKY